MQLERDGTLATAMVPWQLFAETQQVLSYSI